MILVLRRLITIRSLANPRRVVSSGFSSRASSTIPPKENESMHLPSVDCQKGHSFGNYSERLHLSPLFSESSEHHLKNLRIELVDDEAWAVSSGLADAWKGNKSEVGLERKALNTEEEEEEDYSDIGTANYVPPDNENPDFDEIEDMRIRGILFYKLDKDSKEYEEYKFDFHRKKSSKNKADQKVDTKTKEKKSRCVASGTGKDLKNKDGLKEMKKEKLSPNYGLTEERFRGIDQNWERFCGTDQNGDSVSGVHGIEADFAGKRLRTPTFNQLTAPYHEPFCLDIYVSKGSVRASIIHRATSKVVAVAHSISKDMKLDLGSTKSRSTCVAVGEVLAQRALADDIHNIVYTPRKGEKLEGKLQIVLQSIIDNGVAVKVKIKQRKVRKGGIFGPKPQ